MHASWLTVFGCITMRGNQRSRASMDSHLRLPFTFMSPRQLLLCVFSSTMVRQKYGKWIRNTSRHEIRNALECSFPTPLPLIDEKIAYVLSAPSLAYYGFGASFPYVMTSVGCRWSQSEPVVYQIFNAYPFRLLYTAPKMTSLPLSVESYRF